uniref:Transketolase-like pyrimidine-binding domain-containing protein n=1 Tax=Palpitomonas bilix TaxID=652834 RepID=A0A7S3D124_9EUKA|mmetsp:Transcript_16927/g.42503  ORF Transcript_16927/g.42503 Transcript_16927/m.42503 type:complete len:919 (+) Transcript_16927:122-2878(+)
MSRLLSYSLKSSLFKNGLTWKSTRALAWHTTARYLSTPSVAAAARERMYRFADVNPLYPSSLSPEEKLAKLGLEVSEETVEIAKIFGGSIALQTAHVESQAEKDFLNKALEDASKKEFSAEEKKRMLKMMIESEALDKFMGSKYPFFKRYSGEGCEALLPCVDSMVSACARNSANNVVIGMPHRGRFNLLVGVLDFPARALFSKIEGNCELPPQYDAFPGDVASHLAQSVKLGSVSVSLLHNPSHLEAIHPVAVGKVRRKQELFSASSPPHPEALRSTIPLVMHGDAAFAGQGIVAEAINMASSPGFDVGGTVHLVVNNQVGFTAEAHVSRSSMFVSDAAKGVGSPIIAVNGDDPEAVSKAMSIAVEYRQKYGKDVFVELICYRRHGHNELDEPAFTQPLMYKNIRSRTSPPRVYAEKLKEEGVIDGDFVTQVTESAKEKYNEEKNAVSEYTTPSKVAFGGMWHQCGVTEPSSETLDAYLSRPISDVLNFDHPSNPDTGVLVEELREIARRSIEVPENIEVHPRLQKMYVKNRLEAIDNNKGVDWATAEAMAFGSILEDGYCLRMTGQDVERGTFSQRHAALVCQSTAEKFMPFKDVEKTNNSNFSLYSSVLSEEAVLGFEYGYSINDPNQLTLWEAQFGDFFNGAQIIFDNFISSSEAKWLRQTGLTVLLPHGFDGAGPEHSSCRMERFLQLADDGFSSRNNRYNVDKIVPGDSGDYQGHNMAVVNPTSPAQYFHLLRRQVMTPFRKPLIVVAPKTLLRLREAVSDMDEFAPGKRFQHLLFDEVTPDAKTMVICSGKIYYDLAKKRAEAGIAKEEAPIVRLEQLSPFPTSALAHLMSGFKGDKVVFVQEEPENNGPLPFSLPRIEAAMKYNQHLSHASLDVVSRPPSGTVAAGYRLRHEKEVKELFGAFTNAIGGGQ